MQIPRIIVLFFCLFSGLTSSVSDLETVQQQYSLQRMYAARKFNPSNVIYNHHNGLSTTTTTTNSLNNTKYSNHNSGMTHSQSTGDVATIFGRA